MQNHLIDMEVFLKPDISCLGVFFLLNRSYLEILKKTPGVVFFSPRIHGLLNTFQNNLLEKLLQESKQKNRFNIALISVVFHMFSMCFLHVLSRCVFHMFSMCCPCFPCVFSMRHFSIWKGSHLRPSKVPVLQTKELA